MSETYKEVVHLDFANAYSRFLQPNLGVSDDAATWNLDGRRGETGWSIAFGAAPKAFGCWTWTCAWQFRQWEYDYSIGHVANGC